MPMSRDEMVEQVRRLLNVEIAEQDEEEVIDQLIRDAGEPLITDYMYYSDPPLCPEDVVDLALKRRVVAWTPFKPQ